MKKNTTLSIKICSIVNDIVTGSHDSLDTLFESAGAPGPPPPLAHHSKWKMWLKQVSEDPEIDAHSVLGKIIEEFMEVEPAYDDSDYYQNKKRMVDALDEDGLRYEKGGKIIPIPKGFGIESLSQALRKRNFQPLEIEFKRAIEGVDKDPATAITAACSLLEALFTAYLETNLIELPVKKSIKPLWTTAQKHIGLDPKGKDDQDIRKILSGMISIVDGIGSFRTHGGSAHGGGFLRYRVSQRHARLTVNTAHTLATFFIETWEEKYKQGIK